KATSLDEGDLRVYRWSGNQLKPTPKRAETISNAPQLPEIQWTTFHTWAAVGDWYRNLAKDRPEPSAAIKAKADDLVSGLKTEDEKIRALYAFVSLQVRYVGVAFGVGRYQPHRSGEILLTGYGDCKDKHTLLQSMLQAEGIQAFPVLIGSGIKLNEQVPSPGAFNHLITAVPQQDGLLWLDTTSEVAPYGMLLANIRGTKGLIVREGKDSILAETPNALPFENIDRFEAEGTLNEKGEMNAHNKIIVRGDSEVVIRGIVRQVAPVQIDQVAQYISSRLGFGGTASNAHGTPVEKTDAPFTLEYDYKRSPYGDWPNRRIIALTPFLIMPGVDEENPPKDPIFLGGPKTDMVLSKIHLPAGAGAQLPHAVHEHSEFGSFDKTYMLEDHILVVERTLKVTVKEVPASDWKKYQAFYKKTAGLDEPWISLTGMGGDNSAVEDSNPDVAALMQEAQGAGVRSQWQREREILAQVEKINPKEPLLYSMRGLTYLRELKFEEAERDFRKEFS
ncbi:MAG: transglutaminase domain-containing protein, partial [Acidobacteriales bacterium]|nr:transglutaminase domain-containing protein [Terriglobales bacterium]